MFCAVRTCYAPAVEAFICFRSKENLLQLITYGNFSL